MLSRSRQRLGLRALVQTESCIVTEGARHHVTCPQDSAVEFLSSIFSSLFHTTGISDDHPVSGASGMVPKLGYLRNIGQGWQSDRLAFECELCES